MSQPQVDDSSRHLSSFLGRGFKALGTTRSAGETSEDIRGPLGLVLLHAPIETRVDFIFVHGLGGGSRKTWSKTGSISHFWPKIWLPEDPTFRNVRIHSYGYNSNWGELKGSTLTIQSIGQKLLAEIASSPQICGFGSRTPIILIGHSMGGIVIKRAFLLAKPNPLYKGLADRFHSMFFLATPHRGADSAQLLNRIMQLSVVSGSKAYVKDLIPNSGTIQAINEAFRHHYREVHLWSFFETVPTGIGLIVEQDSATLDLPFEHIQALDADHRNVCKFDNESDSNYRALRNALGSTVDAIEHSWLSTNKEENRAQMRLLSEYLGIAERPEADLARVLESKVDGSCEWLVKLASFMQWRDGEDNDAKCFWVSGGPATGKSTIAGSVVKHLEDMQSPCMYYFFRDGDATKSTISEMLRSLTWQMASVNREIRQILLKMQDAGDSIDRSNPRSFWRTVFATRILSIKLRQPLYWVIDGLDECQNFEIIFPLLDQIERKFPLRIFLTSRPYVSIQRPLSQAKIGTISCEITREVSQRDIRLFLQANVIFFPVDEQSEREELVEQILEKSDGNFLWVSLVLKELMNTHSKQQIYDVLKSVPQEMDGLYTRIIQKISADSRNKNLANTVLKWVVCAARALTAEELKEAVRLDIGETLSQPEKTAGSLCGHLIYVDSKKGMQVAHETVRSFLLRRDGSEFAFDRKCQHRRLLEVCLKYLCSEEMNSAPYARGSSNTTPSTKRSMFAQYAAEHFADHLARSTSSNDDQLVPLNTFLASNAFTWIELVSRTGSLVPLAHAAKSITAYLERRAKYFSPLGQEVQNISAWARDLIQLVARFGKALLASPHAIQLLIPPVCPPDSILAKTFKNYPRALEMVGMSRRDWDDQLCCIALVKTQVRSVSCRDNKFAFGASDCLVRIHHAVTFQEETTLNHGEPVHNVKFGSINTLIASGGRKKIKIWNSASGMLLKALEARGVTLALDFSMDDSILMIADKGNTLHFCKVADDEQVETCQFSDIDEMEGTAYSAQPPTHAYFSAELNLLAVTYLRRPVSLWDLEDRTFRGQLHQSSTISYPGQPIFALLLSPNPGLALAAVAYHDGEVVTFDVWSQQRRASTNTYAAVLACSTDGAILATGDGIGLISLFEFETLQSLYRINTIPQTIRSMVFSSEGRRFFDVRHHHCNIWEPPVLLRYGEGGDTSSMADSDAIPSAPQVGSTEPFDEDRFITAIATHHSTETVICGRENGTIALYSTTTGEVLQELFTLTQNVAALFVEWNPAENLLACVDCSGHIQVRQLAGVGSTTVNVGSPLFDKKASGAVVQLLMSPDGKMLLSSTSQSDELRSLNDSTVVFIRSTPSSAASKRWIPHPSDSAKILFFHGTQLYICRWDTLERAFSTDDGIEVGLDPGSLQFCSSSLHESVCIVSPGCLKLLRTNRMSPESKALEDLMLYEKLGKSIKCIVGYYKTQLVFLSHEGWICSIKADDHRRKQSHYSRHFFIPSRLHTIPGELIINVSLRGSILLVYGEELVVFKNGLGFKEVVALEKGAGPLRSQAKISLRKVQS